MSRAIDYLLIVLVMLLALGANVAIDAMVQCDRQAEIAR